uniref:Uncharacterized protein n=1 Tax=Glossina austeni TaxID=7395 RepID=A0A1A9ULK0_GLOAU
MAKLCSPFSTSPRTSFLNDLLPTHSSFMDEFYITPDPFEVFGELPSIYSDIQKMESESGSSASCTALDWYDECDVKPELPNCDLMWPVPHANSSSSISSDLAVSPSVVTGNILTNIRDGGTNRLSIKEEPKSPASSVSIMTIKKVNHQESFQLASLERIKVEVKKEPIDDYDVQLRQQNIPNNKTVQQHQRSIHNAPPGTSLLRKSNNSNSSSTQQRKLLQQQPQQRQTTQSTKRDHLLSCAPASHTNANNYRNNSSSGSFQQPACTPQLYQRPDTPHSLDDDSSTTEFKHNIDLSACVMGSNSISLTDSQFIQQVSQELQDTSKSQIALCMDSESSLSDVLDVISTEATNTSTSSPPLGTNRQINNSMSDGGSYANKNNNRNNVSITSSSSSIVHSNSFRSSECDSDDDISTASSMSENETAYNRAMMASSAVSPVSSQNSSSSPANNVHSTQHHMDHSYTRLDDMGTNLDTPSDSVSEGETLNDRQYMFFVMESFAVQQTYNRAKKWNERKLKREVERVSSAGPKPLNSTRCQKGDRNIVVAYF